MLKIRLENHKDFTKEFLKDAEQYINCLNKINLFLQQKSPGDDVVIKILSIKSELDRLKTKISDILLNNNITLNSDTLSKILSEDKHNITEKRITKLEKEFRSKQSQKKKNNILVLHKFHKKNQNEKLNSNKQNNANKNKLPSIDLKQLNKDIISLQSLLKSAANEYSKAENIHKFENKDSSIMKLFMFAKKLDNKYKISSNSIGFTKTKNAILDLSKIYGGKQNANVKTVLNTIEKTGTDKTTSIDMKDLLVRTWQTSKKNKSQYNVIFNLDSNILDGGGCPQGIAIRLTQPYTKSIAIALNRLPESVFLQDTNSYNLKPFVKLL